MNKRGSSWLVLAFFVSLRLDVAANDLVSFPTGAAAWTINVSNSPNNHRPHLQESPIAKIEVTQNDEFLRSIVIYSNNSTRENWSIAHSSLFLSEDPRGTPFVTPTSKVFFVPFLPSSFNWVQSKFLQEKTPIEYQGKLCLHYKGPMASSPSNGPLGPGQTLQGEAWIDGKTLQPVALDDGSLLASFTFHPPPPGPLALPAKYKLLFDGYKAVMGIPKDQ